MSLRTKERTFFVNTTTQLIHCLQTKLELDYPNKKGETLRNNLLSVQRQSTAIGKPYIDPRLELPTQPDITGAHIWDAFWSINISRGGTGYGPAPFTCAEILSWIHLYKQHFDMWEIDAIRLMDKTYLETVAKISEE